jgi:phosphate starvation-inducible protein PhoH and related proteins
MKTFISRLGEDSKLVIMGDTDQVDLRLAKGEKCGLEDAWDRLQGIPGVGFVEFTEYDIVRDPFLIEIMKRYKQN